MMRIICNIVYIVFMIGYLPIFFIKLRQAHDKKRLLSDRIGRYTPDFAAYVRDHRVIWVHAVSVGEVLALQTFLGKLRESFPTHRIVLSTVTPTGNAIAHKIAQGKAAVFYFPLDISWVTNRVMQCIKPELIILMETELWPNLIMSAKQYGAQVVIINGRISPRSFRSYYRMKRLLRPVLCIVDQYMVQTERYKKRLIKMGVSDTVIRVMGNMKFDSVEVYTNEARTVYEKKRMCGFEERDLVLIAASTHRGEETVLCDAFKKIRALYPQVRMILAPRHIERALEVGTILDDYQLTYTYAQEIRKDHLSEGAGKRDVFILNTIGELKKLYVIADVVYMGGSLIPHGGQNPLEALAFKKAIISGPHVHNFSDIYDELQRRHAVRMITSSEELSVECLSLFRDIHTAHRMGEEGYQWLMSMKGASDRTCTAIKELLRKQ